MQVYALSCFGETDKMTEAEFIQMLYLIGIAPLIYLTSAIPR